MAFAAESFAPELRLITRGARLRPSSESLEILRGLAQQPLDWKLVGRLGKHHQVLPVVLHHLYQLGIKLPDEVSEGFKAYARGVALQNMILVEQLKVVHGWLEEAGVPVMHFKGPVLTLQAYENLALRVCSDIDLLVKPEDLARAGGVFTGNGFMPGSKLQRWYGLRRRFFLYLSQQATFVHRSNHIHLDVHIGLAPPLYAYPTDFDALFERGEELPLGSHTVRTFGPVDTLILLCLHGEKNRWEFLKYVADIAAVITTHPDLDWEEVMRRAEDTHMHRIVRLGLLLAHTLVEAPLPPEVAERLQNDALVRQLRDAVVERLSSMSLEVTDFEKRFWLHLHTQDSLLDRARYLGVAALRWVWDRRTATVQ